MVNELDVLNKSRERKILNFEDVIKKYKENGYQIITEQARYSSEKLVEEFSKKIDPEYQRRLVWDIRKKSKLIESLIINIPIPPIFLYEYDLYEYEVMDGQQRISTITSFLNDDFKLEGLEIWSELNNLSYSELDIQVQRSIKRRYISAIILLKETASNELEEKALKQLIFERLNTGGTELNYQEIRNALYQGKFNRRLITMSENTLFTKLFSLSQKAISRMDDVELVLRFFSYISAIHLSISGSTKNILDSYAEKSIGFSEEDCDDLQSIFEKTLNTAHKIFGDTVFQSTKTGKSEKMIFDTTMIFSYFYNSEILDKYHDITTPVLENEKFQIIENNKKEIFNGKLTAIKVVSERVSVFRNSFL